MDWFFAIGNIVFGLVMTLIGFKVYNPIKSLGDPEKEAAWFKKYGTFFKLGGAVILVIGVLNLMRMI